MGAGAFNRSRRGREIWRAIGQKHGKAIGRGYQDAHIDGAVNDLLAEMININNKQIAACGHLNFDAKAHARAVNDAALGPVDVPRLFPLPAASAGKLLINAPPHRGSAI
ncbi:MAG: hypothetical protein U0587_12750 [Candidatus Binatia bacterium]